METQILTQIPAGRVESKTKFHIPNPGALAITPDWFDVNAFIVRVAPYVNRSHTTPYPLAFSTRNGAVFVHVRVAYDIFKEMALDQYPGGWPSIELFGDDFNWRKDILAYIGEALRVPQYAADGLEIGGRMIAEPLLPGVSFYYRDYILNFGKRARESWGYYFPLRGEVFSREMMHQGMGDKPLGMMPYRVVFTRARFRNPKED